MTGDAREWIDEVGNASAGPRLKSRWSSRCGSGGLLFRLRCHPAGAERKYLNDALIHLQDRKGGWPVVTRNVTDVDLLNQLEPDGRILLYRRMEN